MVDELINSGDCGATAMLPYNIYSYSAHRYSTIQAHNVDPHQLKFCIVHQLHQLHYELSSVIQIL